MKNTGVLTSLLSTRWQRHKAGCRTCRNERIVCAQAVEIFARWNRGIRLGDSLGVKAATPHFRPRPTI